MMKKLNLKLRKMKKKRKMKILKQKMLKKKKINQKQKKLKQLSGIGNWQTIANLFGLASMFAK